MKWRWNVYLTPTTVVTEFFFFLRFTHSNFQICSIVLWSIVTMLYIISPWLIYFTTGSLCLLIFFTHFPLSPSLTSGNPQSVLWVYEVFFFFLKIYIIQYLSFSDWFHLAQCPQGPSINGKISLFSNGWKIFHCIYILKGKVSQSCQTLCDPIDYAVHWILQARILEWVAFPFFSASSQARTPTEVYYIAGGFLTNWAIQGT